MWLDTNEHKQGELMTIDKNAQISVTLNGLDSDASLVNLINVFHIMKERRRVYAWVLVLCIFVGLCVPLVMYQFTKPKLTVASVVTLNYDAKALTAPDGTDLDLSQIYSSYVLNNALKDLKLSYPISINELRSNIKIQRVLSEEGRQAQELAAKMAEEKNAAAYEQLEKLTLTYDNRFIVSLTNGFRENEESRQVTDLESSELRLVLNRVLDAYNDYLALTYADMKLPDDQFSIIDPTLFDIPESLELLDTAMNDLYTYCEDQQDSVKKYRSWKTGRTLEDWMQILQTTKEVSVDYLYSYVYANSIVKNRDEMLQVYQYRLRTAQTALENINKDIETLDSILKNYKNDEIFVSMQESDSSKSTSTTTDYFNKLILEQADNFQKAAETETQIANLNDKISRLNSFGDEASLELNTQEEIMEDVKKSIEKCCQIYSQIKDHMEEAHENAQFRNFIEHTAAQGKERGFLASSVKNMIIGAVLGGFVGCGLWFLFALGTEFFKFNRPQENGKKVAVQ